MESTTTATTPSTTTPSMAPHTISTVMEMDTVPALP